MLLNSFRTVLSAAALIALACGLNAAFASGTEHPEHPQKEQPERSESKKASSVTLEDVAQFIEVYVKKESKGGAFKIKDSLAKKNLSLTLDKVHRERLSQIGPDMFFVCADFMAKEGKVYDLDFFVQGKDKESLKVIEKQTSIHKEEGKERYTWEFDKEKGLWVKKEVKAAGKRHSEFP